MDNVLADYQTHKINGAWFECQIAKPKFQENCDTEESYTQFGGYAEDKCGISDKTTQLNDDIMSFNTKKCGGKKRCTKKVVKLFDYEENPLFGNNNSSPMNMNNFPSQRNTMTYGKNVNTQVYNYSIDEPVFQKQTENRMKRNHRTMAGKEVNRNAHIMNAMMTYQNTQLANDCGENATIAAPPGMGSSMPNVQMPVYHSTSQTEYYHPYSTPNIPSMGYSNNYPFSDVSGQQHETQSLKLFPNVSPQPEKRHTPSPRKTFTYTAELPIPAREVLQKRQQIEEDLAKHNELFSYKKIERERTPETKKATFSESLKIFCFDQTEKDCSTKSNTSIDTEDELTTEEDHDFKDELKKLPFISSWLLDDYN